MIFKKFKKIENNIDIAYSSLIIENIISSIENNAIKSISQGLDLNDKVDLVIGYIKEVQKEKEQYEKLKLKLSRFIESGY
jgi:hypothetical protein